MRTDAETMHRLRASLVYALAIFKPRLRPCARDVFPRAVGRCQMAGHYLTREPCIDDTRAAADLVIVRRCPFRFHVFLLVRRSARFVSVFGANDTCTESRSILNSGSDGISAPIPAM